MSQRMDVLWRFYDEHATQARRHEEHRERMTSLIMVLSGGLVALVGQNRFALYSLPAALMIIFLGFYGWLFSKKHYERNQLHLSILRETRMEIDRLLQAGAESEHDSASNRTLTQIRDSADQRHYKGFPQERGGFQKHPKTKWIARRRLHHFWEGLHIAVMLIGIILVGIIIVQPAGLASTKPMEVRIAR